MIYSSDGSLQCTSRLPYGARIAIGASICTYLCYCMAVLKMTAISMISVGSILLSVGLFLLLRGRRSRQQAVIYQVDASQIQGPPTTYVTNLDPRSAAAPYSQTPGIVISPAPGTAPAEQYPATQERYSRYGAKPPQTAPVNQGYGGSYPFPGYSPVSAFDIF
jgi:hypothetical protein